MGLISSSLDATLCMLDLERGKLAARVALHRKGVRTFGYSPAFSLVARWGCGAQQHAALGIHGIVCSAEGLPTATCSGESYVSEQRLNARQWK